MSAIRVEKRECKESGTGWTRWAVFVDGRFYGYFDTEEEAYREMREEGY